MPDGRPELGTREDAQGMAAPPPPDLPWVLLERCAIAPGTVVDLLALQPETGIAVLEIAPGWTPDAVPLLRAGLEASGFAARHPGHLPIIHRRLRTEDLPILRDLLRESFHWQAPLTLPRERDWVADLRAVLRAIPSSVEPSQAAPKASAKATPRALRPLLLGGLLAALGLAGIAVAIRHGGGLADTTAPAAQTSVAPATLAPVAADAGAAPGADDPAAAPASVTDAAPTEAPVADAAPTEAAVAEATPPPAPIVDAAPPPTPIADAAPPPTPIANTTPLPAPVADAAPPSPPTTDATAAPAPLVNATPTEPTVSHPPPPPGGNASPLTHAFLARGRALLALGDVSGARLLLARAAEAGSGAAALLLGDSYDAAQLAALGARGIAPDRAQARHWYERAAALGEPGAARHLGQAPGQQPR